MLVKIQEGYSILAEVREYSLNIAHIVLVPIEPMNRVFEFFNGQYPAYFCLFPVFFKETSIQFNKKLMWTNVYQVNGAGIQTHNLQNISLLPYALDQWV